MSHKENGTGIYNIMRKRIIGIIVVCAVLLARLDEKVKTLILRYDGQAINNFDKKSGFIYYRPVFQKGEGIFSGKLDMPYRYWIFVGVGILGILFSLYLFRYFWKARKEYNCNGIIFVPVTVFLAACIGRVTERLIWDYTLDYIAVKNAGVLDLIDIYLWVGGLGLLIVNFYIQILERRAKRCSC